MTKIITITHAEIEAAINGDDDEELDPLTGQAVSVGFYGPPAPAPTAPNPHTDFPWPATKVEMEREYKLLCRRAQTDPVIATLLRTMKLLSNLNQRVTNMDEQLDNACERICFLELELEDIRRLQDREVKP
jgi:hypothetical protein